MKAGGTSFGFSLIELVVSMLLLAIIAIAVQSGLHFGIQVWQASEREGRAAKQIRTSQTVVRAALYNTLPTSDGEYSSFDGKPSVVAFDAAPIYAFKRFGPAHVVISILSVGASQSLHISMSSLSSGTVMKTTLISGLSRMRFEYLDTREPAGTWLARWSARTHLPAAVRLISAAPARWPEMVAWLPIGETADCRFDPETMTCRNI